MLTISYCINLLHIYFYKIWSSSLPRRTTVDCTCPRMYESYVHSWLIGWCNCSTLLFKHLCSACGKLVVSSCNNNCSREKLFENFKLYFSWQSLDICLFYYQPGKKRTRENIISYEARVSAANTYRVISDTKEAGSRHISEYCLNK